MLSFEALYTDQSEGICWAGAALCTAQLQEPPRAGKNQPPSTAQGSFAQETKLVTTSAAARKP